MDLNTLHVDVRKVLAGCIERGVAYGIMRAHKHTDAPSREDLAEQVEHGIWLEIDDLFSFPEEA